MLFDELEKEFLNAASEEKRLGDFIITQLHAYHEQRVKHNENWNESRLYS